MNERGTEVGSLLQGYSRTPRSASRRRAIALEQVLHIPEATRIRPLSSEGPMSERDRLSQVSPRPDLSWQSQGRRPRPGLREELAWLTVQATLGPGWAVPHGASL